MPKRADLPQFNEDLAEQVIPLLEQMHALTDPSGGEEVEFYRGLIRRLRGLLDRSRLARARTKVRAARSTFKATELRVEMALEEDISSDDDIARATTRWASKTVSDARKTIREAVEELRSTGTTSIPAFLRELFGPDFEFGATPLDVEITEEDFRNGSVKDPEQCPIAFALWRYFDEYAFLNRPTSIRGLAEEAELEYGEARVLNAALDPEVIVLLANHQDGRPISAPVSARIWLDTWSPK